MGTGEQVLKDWTAKLGAGDLDGSMSFVADDVEFANPVALVRGKDELRGLLEVFWTAIPDFQHDVTDVISSGELVALRGTGSGTHTGPLASPTGEVPASGRAIPFAAFARVEDGLIREFRGYWDVLGFMQQIGAIPEPAAASASS